MMFEFERLQVQQVYMVANYKPRTQICGGGRLINTYCTLLYTFVKKNMN